MRREREDRRWLWVLFCWVFLSANRKQHFFSGPCPMQTTNKRGGVLLEMIDTGNMFCQTNLFGAQNKYVLLNNFLFVCLKKYCGVGLVFFFHVSGRRVSRRNRTACSEWLQEESHGCRKSCRPGIRWLNALTKT